MTSLPAQVLRLRDRGMLRPGNWADLVVFDPDRVGDRATFSNPKQYPVGIDHVLVNGCGHSRWRTHGCAARQGGVWTRLPRPHCQRLRGSAWILDVVVASSCAWPRSLLRLACSPPALPRRTGHVDATRGRANLGASQTGRDHQFGGIRPNGRVNRARGRRGQTNSSSQFGGMGQNSRGRTAGRRAVARHQPR